MRCEHYWRDGILLVERGRPDPHRDDCLDCRREHESRSLLVSALQLVGAGGGDPRWQARVWRQIEQGRAPARVRPWLPWASAFAVACAFIVFVSAGGLLGRERERVDEGAASRPVAEIVDAPRAQPHRGELRAHGPTSDPAQRLSAIAGDFVRLWAASHHEVRLYRGEALLARCAAGEALSPRCLSGAAGLVLVYPLDAPGRYSLVVAAASLVATAPAGTSAHDLAELASSGIGYQRWVITVD